MGRAAARSSFLSFFHLPSAAGARWLGPCLVAAGLSAASGCPAPSDPPGDAGADGGEAPDAPAADAPRPPDAPDAPGDPCADPDADGDGVDSMACGGDDCDDADPDRAPGHLEVCDAADVDEDCDGATFGDRDADGDDHVDAACCNGATCGDDCDDTRADVRPGQVEVCDGRDNDCNAAVDEGALRTYTRDADGDGFGSAAVGAETAMGCAPSVGFVENATDCDDAVAAVNPGESELCDAAEGAGIDHDCDGTRNEGCACGDGASLRCDDLSFGDDVLLGACAAGTRTCVAGGWSLCSIVPVTEMCNFLDEDCDGIADDGFLPYVTCYDDPDDDGYPGSSVTMGARQCRVGDRTGVGGCPMGMTNRPPISGNIDCAPLNRDVHPGASTYRAQPYCPDPATQLACLTAGAWFCVPTLMPTCRVTSVSASYDYDCDAALTRAPAESCGAAGSVCTSDCGTSGFDYTTPPACGTSVDFVVCGDCGGAGCEAPAVTSMPIGCR